MIVVRRLHIAVALSGALAITLLAADPAPAPVPPKDCGMVRAKGDKFNVKADQIRCRTARTYAKAYLKRSAKPSGYRCKDYGSDTAIEFRCSKGDRVLFAIRR